MEETIETNKKCFVILKEGEKHTYFGHFYLETAKVIKESLTENGKEFLLFEEGTDDYQKFYQVYEHKIVNKKKMV